MAGARVSPVTDVLAQRDERNRVTVQFQEQWRGGLLFRTRVREVLSIDLEPDSGCAARARRALRESLAPDLDEDVLYRAQVAVSEALALVVHNCEPQRISLTGRQESARLTLTVAAQAARFHASRADDRLAAQIIGDVVDEVGVDVARAESGELEVRLVLHL